MRRIAWGLLLLLAFAIPWEYALDWGEPLGNIARIAGVALLLASIPAVLQTRRLRTPGALLWMVLALFVWFCCSYFWSIAPTTSLARLRGYFQEMVVVWLVWEFTECPADLRNLLRAYLAGCWVLAGLTLASFASAQAIAAEQIRFAAQGQDPNDVARFLDLGFPMAAVLLNSEQRWAGRSLAAGYLPLGLVAVLLTASRGGFVAVVVALAGCCILLARSHARKLVAGALTLPVIAAGFWFAVPHETLERLATIPRQLSGGDLNQRWNIWNAGWHAFVKSPFLGTGAGSFVTAAGLNPMDTAHNTALSILSDGGLCALLLASVVLFLAGRAVVAVSGPLQVAITTALTVWMVVSLVSTLEANRATWLLLGLIAVAGRLAEEDRQALEVCFAASSRWPETLVGSGFSGPPADSPPV